MGTEQKFVAEINDGSARTMVYGWGAVAVGVGVGALGIGLVIAAFVLAQWAGLALLLVGAGVGFGAACTGAGEGLRRAFQGWAEIEQAKRGTLPAPHTRELPPYTRR